MNTPFRVQHGTAEALARVVRFRQFETVQPEELTAVARWIVGRVDDPEQLLTVLHDDCQRLWHLLTDDWDDRDLDGLTDDEWERYDFATQQQEIDHRYAATRARLCADIERAIWHARCRAADLAGRRAVAS